MKGVDRLRSIFESCRAEARAALILYYPAGFPDIPQSLKVLEGLACSGADILEIGMPFSDPLADGPTIQAASQQALAAGITTRACLDAAVHLRRLSPSKGLVMMGYLNPIVAYGMERWVEDAAAAGVDGVILPDLPPEEADEFQSLCEAHGLANIYLISPATPLERARQIAERAQGFIYLVSLTGVTGARQRLPDGLEEFVRRSRQITTLPLAVGFGISTPEQARMVGQLADGVIIGSALIDTVRRAEDAVAAAAEFTRRMRAALEGVQVG